MSNEPVHAAIALGSNLGDRRAHLEAAFAAIARTPGIKLLARGLILENPALKRRGVTPGGAYLNSAAVVRTTLEPHQLLARLLHIERDHGRDRSGEKPWAPRTLDLDLLLVGSRTIDDEHLTLPHPRMHERDFVLIPLSSIAPDWPIPGRRVSVHEALARVRPGSARSRP